MKTMVSVCQSDDPEYAELYVQIPSGMTYAEFRHVLGLRDTTNDVTRWDAIILERPREGIKVYEKWADRLNLFGYGPPGTDLDWVTESGGRLLFHEAKEPGTKWYSAQRRIYKQLLKIETNSALLVSGKGTFGQSGFDLEGFWYIPSNGLCVDRDISGYRYVSHNKAQGWTTLHNFRQLWADACASNKLLPTEEDILALGLKKTKNPNPLAVLGNKQESPFFR